MMARSDVYDIAYDDYVRALTANANDVPALEGLVKAALLSGRARDALGWVRGVTEGRPPSAAAQVAISKLLAAINLPQEALDTAIRASALTADRPIALEQMASLYADAGDGDGLESTVARLQTVAPDRAPTLYYAAALAFVQGRAEDTVRLSERAIAADSTYAPTYDLLGAAYTRLGQGERARQAFESSLRFDAHDSTAYTNLGLLELAAGNRTVAANYFAEALSLTPGSTVARDGLAHAR
jgi:Flp pilus assembly protein TadD